MSINPSQNNQGAHVQGSKKIRGANRVQGATRQHIERIRTSGGVAQSKGNLVQGHKAQVIIEDVIEELDPVPEQWVHPWKVTTNGDDSPATVAVAAGHIMYMSTEDDLNASQAYYNLDLAASYAGGDVTVTGTGYIYAKLDMTVDDLLSEAPATDETFLLQTVAATGTITLHFATNIPSSGSGNAHIKIAKVSLASSVAVVDAQYITHNPNITASALAVI